MNNERIEPRSLFCFKDFRDSNRIQRISGQSVNSFGGPRDNVAYRQQFTRRSTVGCKYCFHFDNFAANTASDCFLRNPSNFSRIMSLEVARIAAARRAAFFAPASPIANVPTGIPLGIWAVDKSESSPWSFD